ncbi:hypothetical protein C0J52_07485 [Blattella germanica]|nr:hypothetical protein C0J52_07485 [Blattella germanica]
MIHDSHWTDVLLFQQSVCEGSVSSDSLGGRSISPARSDESASRSASPPAPSLPPMMNPPARPARKRRPAPKPPGPPDGPSTKQNTQDAAVSHSRNSSDSSGYHEASVLSDSPAEAQQMPDTLPRRGKVSARSTNPGGLSRSMSSLTSCQHSTSNTSLASSTGELQHEFQNPQH